ncbi:MAG: hypothetical protein ACLPZR_15440 [Solirubrobacteraceae bacterium]
MEELLGAGKGLTTAILAERLKGDRGQVLALLLDLEATGRVRRTAERRGTRWHLISDEDRITARAAEPESEGNRRGRR